MDGSIMRLIQNRIFWSFIIDFYSVSYCITVEICDVALFAFRNRIKLPSLAISLPACSVIYNSSAVSYAEDASRAARDVSEADSPTVFWESKGVEDSTFELKFVVFTGTFLGTKGSQILRWDGEYLSSCQENYNLPWFLPANKSKWKANDWGVYFLEHINRNAQRYELGSHSCFAFTLHGDWEQTYNLLT